MIKNLKHLFYRFQNRLLRGKAARYKPVILVTGCSSGIGLAVARMLYTQNQYRVVVTARESSLSVLQAEFSQSDRFILSALDVTSDSQRRALISEIETHWGHVDILINNAGICYRAVVEHMEEDDEYRQIETNYLGPMALIRLVLPGMREAGRGKIINISSVSGMVAMPTMSSYSASKHALEGACEALWYEAKPFGIDVSLVQPGFVHSKSFERVCIPAAAAQSIARSRPYSDYYEHMGPFIAKLMRMSLTSPEKVARVILKVIRREDPPLWIRATLDAKIFAFLRGVLPASVFLNLLYFGLPSGRLWAKKFTHKRHVG